MVPRAIHLVNSAGVLTVIASFDDGTPVQVSEDVEVGAVCGDAGGIKLM